MLPICHIPNRTSSAGTSEQHQLEPACTVRRILKMAGPSTMRPRLIQAAIPGTAAPKRRESAMREARLVGELGGTGTASRPPSVSPAELPKGCQHDDPSKR